MRIKRIKQEKKACYFFLKDEKQCSGFLAMEAMLPLNKHWLQSEGDHLLFRMDVSADTKWLPEGAFLYEHVSLGRGRWDNNRAVCELLAMEQHKLH